MSKLRLAGSRQCPAVVAIFTMPLPTRGVIFVTYLIVLDLSGKNDMV